MLKVTVLIAVKNSEKFIRGCLDSLLTQTIIDDTEIMVIDGNSRENEKEIVAEYQKKYPNIKYIFTKKSGIYLAWNLGIKHSKGKYITNLNCDDRLKKNALEIITGALDDNPDIALVYADSYVTFVPNETFENNSSNGKCLKLPEYSHKRLFKEYICGPHPMWRRKIHNKVGYFDEGYKICGDYEFALRVAEKFKMLHILKIIGLHYRNPSGLSIRNPKLALKEHWKARRKYFNLK